MSDEAYEFAAPRQSKFWIWSTCLWINAYLRKRWGMDKISIIHAEKLLASVKAGHGILLTPNHSRPSDPVVLFALTKQLKLPLHIMGSAHLFREKVNRWILTGMGAFSINREGMDREALKAAISILTNATRPLVIFPEGVITRTNDRVIHLQEGISFIARSAAKSSADVGKQVVIHPLAIRYHFIGNFDRDIPQILTEMEKRFAWTHHKGSMIERVTRIGHAILGLKEVENFGSTREGSIEIRLTRFMNDILLPLEEKFLTGKNTQDETIIIRVKNLRKAMLPDLIQGKLLENDREKRWAELLSLEIAQQAFHFPPDYIKEKPTPERIIETIEKFQEALGDPLPTNIRPWQVTITVGDAIPVSPTRERGTADTLMPELREKMRELLDEDSMQTR